MDPPQKLEHGPKEIVRKIPIVRVEEPAAERHSYDNSLGLSLEDGLENFNTARVTGHGQSLTNTIYQE